LVLVLRFGFAGGVLIAASNTSGPVSLNTRDDY
jgi:hypothetical protein